MICNEVLKESYIKTLLVKSFILNKLYKKFYIKFNNNQLMDLKNKVALDFFFFFKSKYDFIRKVNLSFFSLKKEKNVYTFFFFNLFNLNILNFGFLY
jgi:hypothetical protein